MNNNNLLEDIQKLQNKYYSNNSKNLLFKKQQKLDCASNISNQYDVNILINNTFTLIPNTNKIYLDYNIFKLYANPNNYGAIIEYLLNIIYYCIQRYDNYEVHVNLNTFSVSSCERYKEIIINFCNTCLNNSTNFSAKVSKLCIYNIPTVFDTISKILNPFIDPLIYSKIVKYNKNETNAILASNNNSYIEYISTN